MKNKNIPEINTSALPDIIFMLLFFFMTITVIRSHEDKVNVDLPEVDKLMKLDYNKSFGHIYLGENGSKLQLNDKFIDLEEIEPALKFFAAEVEGYKTKLYFDKGLKMNKVNQVKLEIRKSRALKVEYVLK